MGYPQKPQVDGGLESEGKKWVIAGIPLRAPLRSISTNKKDDGGNDEDECSTTPTSEEARIPERLSCPPAPRKRRPSRCHFNGVREFFTPPDLESVFIRHVERAK
ncbi:cyclin-dependent protein kinase inhibitor SMR6-like [Macadamia integrifolia]|uniref:cyclin-dependent protein kinase inhibitor SMR6-like n=1 Tax=Macadamia integrifolia TaxID=60698 RepID=UPI001C4EA572|nr:cyclin-dependent protein kinase inhibitor SMR6-like [Macadamia integrifolia]